MTNDLVVRKQMDLTFDEMARAAKAMATSGYFQDAEKTAKAMVKVLAGAEIGLGPFASMTGIHIVKGRPTLGANLIATLIKNDPRYDYQVSELTDDACEIHFFEGDELVGDSRFTREDARTAGLLGSDTWRKYPRNMLFARAISNGARWYTPGVFGGATIYTPDEMGADEDEGSVIIDVTPRNVDTDTGEITEGEVEELPATDDLPPSASGNGASDKRAETSPAEQAKRPRPSAPKGDGDSDTKPFHTSIAGEVAYFNAAPHVAATMNLLDLDYPTNKDEAAAAKTKLKQYASLRADGVEQDEAVAKVKGEKVTA